MYKEFPSSAAADPPPSKTHELTVESMMIKDNTGDDVNGNVIVVLLPKVH